MCVMYFIGCITDEGWPYSCTCISKNCSLQTFIHWGTIELSGGPGTLMIRFFCLGWLKPVLFAMFLHTHVQVEVGSGECWGNLKETAGIPYRGGGSPTHFMQWKPLIRITLIYQVVCKKSTGRGTLIPIVFI